MNGRWLKFKKTSDSINFHYTIFITIKTKHLFYFFIITYYYILKFKYTILIIFLETFMRIIVIVYLHRIFFL